MPKKESFDLFVTIRQTHVKVFNTHFTDSKSFHAVNQKVIEGLTDLFQQDRIFVNPNNLCRRATCLYHIGNRKDAIEDLTYAATHFDPKKQFATHILLAKYLFEELTLHLPKLGKSEDAKLTNSERRVLLKKINSHCSQAAQINQEAQKRLTRFIDELNQSSGPTQAHNEKLHLKNLLTTVSKNPELLFHLETLAKNHYQTKNYDAAKKCLLRALAICNAVDSYLQSTQERLISSAFFSVQSKDHTIAKTQAQATAATAMPENCRQALNLPQLVASKPKAITSTSVPPTKPSPVRLPFLPKVIPHSASLPLLGSPAQSLDNHR